MVTREQYGGKCTCRRQYWRRSLVLLKLLLLWISLLDDALGDLGGAMDNGDKVAVV